MRLSRPVLCNFPQRGGANVIIALGNAYLAEIGCVKPKILIFANLRIDVIQQVLMRIFELARGTCFQCFEKY